MPHTTWLVLIVKRLGHICCLTLYWLKTGLKASKLWSSLIQLWYLGLCIFILQWLGERVTLN